MQHFGGGLVGGVGVIIIIDNRYKLEQALSTMKPGETLYLQTRFNLILGNLLQPDVYTEIIVDANGRVHTRLVHPGGA